MGMLYESLDAKLNYLDSQLDQIEREEHQIIVSPLCERPIHWRTVADSPPGQLRDHAQDREVSERERVERSGDVRKR